MKKILIILAALLITACASAPKTGTPKTDDTAPVKAGSEAAPAKADKVEADQTSTEIQTLQNQSVYFDFDNFLVKSEYQDILFKQAAYAKAHPTGVVILQGNTDERGSSEYNLALGSKRANAVKSALKILGVKTTQMREISYGEEKPRLTCHDDSCWKENRRVDFIHQVD